MSAHAKVWIVCVIALVAPVIVEGVARLCGY